MNNPANPHFSNVSHTHKLLKMAGYDRTICKNKTKKQTKTATLYTQQFEKQTILPCPIH